MITFYVADFNTLSQKYYSDIVSSLQIHQLTCPCCGHSGCLEKHAYYCRYIFAGGKKTRLYILRLKCSCGHTHALLPSSVIPYSHILLKDQVLIASSGSHNETVAVLQLSGVGITPRMVRYIFRAFILRWKERLASENISLDSLPELVKGCFRHFGRQFMQDKYGYNDLFLPST